MARVPASETVVPPYDLSLAVREQAARLLLFEPVDTPRCGPKPCSVPRAAPSQDGPTHSIIKLPGVVREAIAITPTGRGSFRDQTHEVLRLFEAAVPRGAADSMTVTSQTVFLAAERDRRECESLFREHFGDRSPVTNYVLQPPCCGAALSVEAWALGGPNVSVERHSPKTLSVSYEGLRWTHCGGLESSDRDSDAHGQTMRVLSRLREELGGAGVGMEDIVRTWFYLGGITLDRGGVQRYFEFNRARADLYGGIRFGGGRVRGVNGHALYPASTGIGMQGHGLAAGCVALTTTRRDIRLLPLENPGQVPAYRYDTCYSPQSPKFSRAMAVLLDDYHITWISGTASIVNSESRYRDDIQGQTHQTLTHIERLISPENFALHGAPCAGATLQDLAKVRVYVKRARDYEACRAICEQRLGHLPAIYAIADVCRPDLLVEIEGVAFSRPCRGAAPTAATRR